MNFEKNGCTGPACDASGACSANKCQEGVAMDASLHEAVVRQLDQYFKQLDGSRPHPLYPLVIEAVERPLLVYAMNYCGDNQCKAAKLLGINRNTLHRKLVYHHLI